MAVSQKRPSVASAFFGGREPADTDYIFQDEQCVVFDEQRNKQAPVHFLVVPKKMIPTLAEASLDDEKLLGNLLIIARQVAKMKGVDQTGFRVVMNEGSHSCQTVQQFYIQVLGGRQMGWPFCHLLLVAKDIAIEKGLNRTGYHVMVDESYKTKTLKSLHVFGRALHHMAWPTGPGSRL